MKYKGDVIPVCSEKSNLNVQERHNKGTCCENAFELDMNGSPSLGT